MQLLPGVGPSTAQTALDALAESPEPMETLTALPTPPRASADWPGFVAMLSDLRSRAAGWPAEIGQVRAWYEPHLERIHEDFEMRRADLLQLEDIAAGYPSRERFLTELTLDPPDATSGQAGVPLLDEDYLILSTIHSAKGQEWKSVFVLDTVDGCIPSDLGAGSSDELEEEDSLNLVVPQRFFTHGQTSTGDRHVYASRTRFIPNSLLQYFERRSWPLAVAAQETGAQRQVRLDVSARMRGMWR
ncbi:MAG: ATP-dependent helicase, partial [Rhizobiales bacterium]|nr:ATP-dependent helicase [Hyphomicrobiales bacterium]